ncbi:oxidoreductase [Frankia sp. Mgl5]|uniref:oxidoreductase n=1 Tax=Frankia sp. Mgl5 TaxID=2933793 RepID=UPI00200C7812|nr:oxidoreductase [Frankia sp. Mgl5]MCK9929906.1 oxidoreductase [Frankia sp. Mgl5]
MSTGTGAVGVDSGASPADLGALLLRQVAELLTGLDSRQVADLIAGHARLAVVSTPAGRPSGTAARRPTGTAARRPAGTAAGAAGRAQVEVPSGAELEELRRSLLDAPSRAAAEQLLDALGPLAVARLRALAVDLGIKGITSRDPRAAVQRKIVDQTAGLRLRSEAMFGGVHGT